MAQAAPSGQRDDWAAQAADTLEKLVGTIAQRTTVPLTTVARAAVYGLVAAVMGLTALILLTIILVRLLDIILPVWLVYLIVGGIFAAAGMFLWRKRTAGQREVKV